MNKIILTGAPSSGKTTLITALWERGFLIVSESAMEVIGRKKEELWGVEAWKDWIRDDKGAIRKLHFQEFIHACLELQLEKEIRAGDNNGEIVFFDRGLIDYFSFAELRWIEVSDTMKERIRWHSAQFWQPKRVFHIELIPENFENRGETGRIITLEEAQDFDRINRLLYKNDSFNIAYGSKEDRIEKILSLL